MIDAMWYRIVAFVWIATCLAAQPGTSDDVRAALNRGVAAFKSAKYADAVSEFQLAAGRDPGNIQAHLYLATAYMVQWIPGAESAENDGFATRAEAEFRKVLALDPQDKTAISSLASLAFNRGKATLADEANRPARLKYFDEAETWYRRLIEIEPQEKTAHYSLGVIEWERFYPALQEARKSVGMKPEDPGPISDSIIRVDLRNRFGAHVEDGIASLKTAISVDPDYDDAMAYLNLLYRERADFRDTLEESKADVELADGLVTEALAARKRKVERSGAGVGVVYGVPRQTTSIGTGGGQSVVEPSERIRVAAEVQARRLIHKPVPVYSEVAKQEQVQGSVRFSVIVGTDGHIQSMNLLSGPPLVVPAAVEAVKQYVYEPTMINGERAEVITIVEVKFTLEELKQR